MNEQLLAVMQRRGELRAKIASQREEVAGIGVRLQAPLAVADQGVAMMRSVISRPVLVIGIAVLAAWRGRRLAGFAGIGWKLWKGYRHLSGLADRS